MLADTWFNARSELLSKCAHRFTSRQQNGHSTLSWKARRQSVQCLNHPPLRLSSRIILTLQKTVTLIAPRSGKLQKMSQAAHRHALKCLVWEIRHQVETPYPSSEKSDEHAFRWRFLISIRTCLRQTWKGFIWWRNTALRLSQSINKRKWQKRMQRWLLSNLRRANETMKPGWSNPPHGLLCRSVLGLHYDLLITVISPHNHPIAFWL